jgi:DNA polymerase-1
MSRYLALDIETDSLNPRSGTILCTGFSDGTYITTDIRAATQKRINAAKAAGQTIVFQNGSFDVKFLNNIGVEVENEYDTMVAAYLLSDRPKGLSLDSLISYYLGLPSHKEDIKSGAVFTDPELLKLYCLKDAELTAQLAGVLTEKLIEEGKLDFFNQLMEVRQMLTKAEARGIHYDLEKHEKKIREVSESIDNLFQILSVEAREITKDCPLAKKGVFNFNSPKQILWLLQTLGCNTLHPIKKTHSADILVLEENKDKHPVVRMITDLRKLEKLHSTLESYREALEPTGIHVNFNCTNTRTGRLSSSGPNLQQVDRDPAVRALFTARPGFKFVIGDLAQIEPRLVAHYSKDPTLLDVFKSGVDFYGTIACEVLGATCSPNEVKDKEPAKRAVAKEAALSTLYGIGANKLALLIQRKGKLPDFNARDAYSFIDSYFKRFPNLKDLQRGIHKVCKERGFITNYYGRKVDVTEEEIFMTGVNSLIQSSASDFMLFKTLELHKRTDAHLIALVHDECIWEVPVASAHAFKADLDKHMTTADFRVPIKFESAVCDSWAGKK